MNQAIESQPKPLISATEAAKLVGLSRSQFYRFIHQDAIPAAVAKVEGCEPRFRRAALLRWVAGEEA